MFLEEAKKYAETIRAKIDDMCDDLLIVGSIRRGKQSVEDIDIVVIPNKQKDAFWYAIARRLENLGYTKIKLGMELMTYEHPKGLFTIDIYRATPKTWGTLTLIRTGSKEHNIKLCRHALRMGLQLSASDGVLQKGQVIASETEEAIFQALKLDYVEPEYREVRF